MDYNTQLQIQYNANRDAEYETIFLLDVLLLLVESIYQYQPRLHHS
jgi:hypothetical protein